ncbi:TRAP transporter permease [Rubrobacter taiwanensis]|uniref:TRAP transporter permease n=1 Tax=Rubrobacter taiwanensis TaxID=185139 RepID=A0A4R1BCR7_9ACTN|nr:TRAP transporter permease [Rubrobacter taiwanensis]TCJ14850.1 TRAP transporter permease [Rubrobacter taiwanensis]
MDQRREEPAVNVERAEKYDKELRYRRFDSLLATLAVYVIAVALSLYHLYAAAFPVFSAHQHRALHLAGILALAFLLYPATSGASRTRLPLYDLALAALGVAVNLYIVLGYAGIVARGTSNYNTTDLVFAAVTIVLVLEAARRLMGWGLPALCILFLLYGYLGRIIPSEIFRHRGYALDDMAAYMYMGLEGIYGTPLGVSANFIILFIIFGAIMMKTGLGAFFNDLALALAGRAKGGPAKVAVISSGFMGSINGSALANVVSTGAFTIPLMKRIGYRPNFAGAVEASASVGGQVLPPIMGAAAFIMAETLGISYATVVLAGVLPALLYYLAVITQVHLRADRMGLVGLPAAEVPRIKEIMKERGHLLFPLLFFIYMLFFAGVSLAYAAFWTIIVSLVVAQLRASTRLGVRELLDALESGARLTISVALACAAVGLIVGIAALTGFGLKLANAIVAVGGEVLFFSLIFTMLAAIMLGVGLPSIPAYIITVTVAAPALVELGVEPLTAHFFVFYFGIFANLTPPVALAAFAASGLSGGSPMRTGFIALKLAIAGFIVPYMFVYSDALLLSNAEGLEALPVAATAIVGVLMLAVAVEGYLFSTVAWPLRALLAAAAILMLNPNFLTDAAGITVAFAVLLWQWRKGRREQEESAPAKEPAR